ncbi:MAG: hypothetical protein EOM61_10855 [Bacteroidia bacterium]|nr:hypothetical protein [Bacteroidia bacterium]
MYIFVFVTSDWRDGAVVLTYTVGRGIFGWIGDVCMDIGLLVGYIASGFCFILTVVFNVASLPSLYRKHGVLIMLLAVVFLFGTFAFPYMLGRGGF